jgi:isoleucyl-tRNA synthetase
MYRNLTAGDPDAPDSVHLCTWPEPKAELIDEELSRQMDVVTSVVSSVLGLRMQEQIRVRQPLGELVAVTSDPDKVAALERFEDQILEELNVKELVIRAGADDVVSYELVPDMRKLGPRLKADAGRTVAALKALDLAAAAKSLEAGDDLVLDVGGSEVRISPDEVEVRREMPEHLASDQVSDILVMLDTEVTPELQAEGWARDTVRHVQQLRKDIDLNIEDRIRLSYETDSAELAAAIEAWREYIMAETLSVEMTAGQGAGEAKTVKIGAAEMNIGVSRA